MAMNRAVAAADPGYNGTRSMPLTNEDECRAAWEYVNSPEAADEYSPAQIRRMKSRIKAAGREYGLDLGEKVAASRNLYGIELARPGTWRLKSGDTTVTPRMLDDAARFAAREDARPGYLKIGHSDDRFVAGDGEPALGWLHNLRVEEDDGHVLKGDLTGVPDWLADAIPKHWPDRSIEGWENWEHDGQKYGLVVDGLALLGVTPPGMSSIRSLRDLPQALGLAASEAPPSARRIVASFGDPTTPAAMAEEPPTTEQEAGQMSLDPVKIREALGLPASASDDEVSAAFAAALPTTTAPEPVAASTQDADDLDKRIAAAAAKGGVITIDAATVAQFQEGMRRMAASERRLEERDRDEAITKAITEGKFPPARRSHYERLWGADPAGTRELIASLSPGLIPVHASGYDGDAEDALFESEYRALFGPVGKKG